MPVWAQLAGIPLGGVALTVGMYVLRRLGERGLNRLLFRRARRQEPLSARPAGRTTDVVPPPAARQGGLS